MINLSFDSPFFLSFFFDYFFLESWIGTMMYETGVSVCRETRPFFDFG